MQPRFYPDAGSLQQARTLPLAARVASFGQSAERGIHATARFGQPADNAASTTDRRHAIRKLAPGVQGICNAVPLSFVLWAAILFVCFG